MGYICINSSQTPLFPMEQVRIKKQDKYHLINKILISIIDVIRVM